MQNPGYLIQVYKQAANVTQKVLEKKGTVKSLALAKEIKNKKQTFALASETLKYQQVIDELVENHKLLKKNKQVKQNYPLFRVIIYDLLFGKGASLLQDFKKMKHKIFKIAKDVYHDLYANLVELKIERKISSNEELIPQELRQAQLKESNALRYIRVNTLKTNVDAVLEEFQKQGIHLVDEPTPENTNWIKKDEHIDNLLVLSPGVELYNHPLVKQGHLVIQDKSSCMSAQVLYDAMKEMGVIDNKPLVLDACAAPGNKTSHIAALIHKHEGSVIAFDKSKKRCKFMENTMKKLGADVKCVNADFLTVSPNDEVYKKAVGIIVDPSCSGSGMNRMDFTIKGEKPLEERLKGLSELQTKLILHAMKFPNVKAIAYSTCSIHEEENEMVVQNVLNQSPNFELIKALPSWSGRGVEKYDFSNFVVRTNPEKDKTRTGFFVCVFVKKNKKRKSENEKGSMKKKRK